MRGRLSRAPDCDARADQGGTLSSGGPEHPPQPPDLPAAPGAPDANAPPDPSPPAAGTPRRADSDALRRRYGNALPRRGLLAGGGGHVSSTWRVVVDFDDGWLKAARTRRPGQRILGELGEETERRIPPGELAELTEAAWDVLERDNVPQVVFTADSMQLLVIADGSRAYELSPAGPITEGPAAELRRLLYGLAWPDG